MDLFLKKVGNSTRNRILGYAILNRDSYYSLLDIVEGTELPVKDVTEEVSKLAKEKILFHASDVYYLNKTHEKVSRLIKIHDGLVRKVLK